MHTCQVKLVLDALFSINLSCRSRYALPKSQEGETPCSHMSATAFHAYIKISPYPITLIIHARQSICGRHIAGLTILLLRADSLMRCERASKSFSSRRKLYLYALVLAPKVSRIHLPSLL
jgi:hypothetical protein